MSAYVADAIIGEVDKQSARDRILKRKVTAKSERDRILSIAKKMTAGKLVLEGRTFRLNETVLQQVKQRQAERMAEFTTKHKKKCFTYLDMCRKADEAILRNHREEDPRRWKNTKDILALIRPLKMVGDKPLPTRRKEIIRRYEQYKFRSRREVDLEIVEEYNQLVDGSEMESEVSEVEVKQEFEIEAESQMDEEDGDTTCEWATFV